MNNTTTTATTTATSSNGNNANPTTSTNPTTSRARSSRQPMTPLRKSALIAGVLYILTFVFSIPVKFGFWHDVLNDENFILGSGSSSGVAIGALFEVLTALTGIGTAVALWSVARRTSERAALGFVTARLLEAATIFVGVFSVMSVLTLRNDVAGTAGADTASLLTTGHALIAVHDWTFLLGPGLMAVVNAFCIGSVMYRSRLIPRIIPTIGLIGAPLLLISDTCNLFGVFKQISGPSAALTLPVAAWELSFGVWMTFKGFKEPAATAVVEAEAEAEGEAEGEGEGGIIGGSSVTTSLAAIAA